MNRSCLIVVSLLGTASLLAALSARADDGGQNMLLVVNPNDENALRIADAYAQDRDIPTNNIVYLAPPTVDGYTDSLITFSQFTSTYVDQLPSIITQRGLDSQIDYIATIGQPTQVSSPNPTSSATTTMSLNYGLSMLTQFQRGMSMNAALLRPSELSQAPFSTSTFNYTPGANTAIHHSNQLPVGVTTPNPDPVAGYPVPGPSTAPAGYSTVQWYMSGTVGYYGMNGTDTTQQIINNLANSVAADGTKPSGPVYFELNNDIRTTVYGQPFWGPVEQYMTANGIPWVQESNQTGNSPHNQSNVRGAVTGSASVVLPNGSTYAPGSFAFNVTSSGANYLVSDQTKADRFIASGASATSGTVTEPYLYPERFPNAAVNVFSNDGSSLGEAFFKATPIPDLQMFQGDLLAQPYADVPKVTITAAPPVGSTVSGTISLTASASLTNPTLATGISQLQLFVDGVAISSLSGASGTFSGDTSALSDGYHEVRIVAVNNAVAQSQGYASFEIDVNNKGESVAASATSFVAAWNQQLQIPVSATNGTGTVVAIQLQELGRVVGQISGASGSVSLNATSLAYGDNVVTPVAIYTDGSHVAGQTFDVTRNFNQVAGLAASPQALQNPGFTIEYFSNAASQTIAQTNFSGTPNYVLHAATLSIDPSSSNAALQNIPDAYRTTAGGSNAALAAEITSSFNITTPGEYSFSLNPYQFNWTSAEMIVDGVVVTQFDAWNGSKYVPLGQQGGTQDTLRSVYLLPGQHQFELLLANKMAEQDATFTTSPITVRAPDGSTFSTDSSHFYTVSTVAGDANLDGIVNGQDISFVASNWLQTGYGTPGDVNGDGIVNGQDIALIASNWLQAAGGGGQAAVPEPSSIVVAALGGLLLLARRRWAHLVLWVRDALCAMAQNLKRLLQMASGVYLTFFGSFVFGTPGFPLSDVPLAQIAADAAAGRLDIKPTRVFGFDEIQEAHRVMESNQAGGKMVVVHN